MIDDRTLSKYLPEFVSDFQSQKYFHLNNYWNFLFLCGANQSPNVPSARRRAVLSFVRKNAPSWHVVIAEKVFDSLENLRDINALDLEHYITDFSDFVLIIMESPSAFAELGAFAHTKLRKKVLVINNERYKDSPSFINTGPIEAIVRSSSKRNLMLYQMREGSNSILDGIGSIFPDLSSHLGSVKGVSRLSKRKLGILEKVTKENLFLIHDLIFVFTGISRPELIDLTKKLFGNQNYKNLSVYLSILYGIELVRIVEMNGEKFYSSTQDKTIIDLPTSTNLIAAARIYAIRGGRI